MDGSVYKGQWKYDLKQGNGFNKWPDSREYIGEFWQGKRDGKGHYIFANGN